MTEKHYPYCGGSFDRIIFDKDGSVWVPEAENAKLREELVFERCENGWAREFLDRMGPKCGTKDCSSLVAYVTKLESDNAKLRELVQTMMRFFEDGDWCDTCEVAKECDAQEQYEEDCLMRGVFRGRMRELGIEVDA